MLQRIRALITDNFTIKLFSLLFAVALWLHVVSKGKSEINFVVPLKVSDIPKDMVVVGDTPGYVDVRLKGQEAVMRALSSQDVGVSVSLKDASEGDTLIYISPSDITVPPGVEISRVSPVELKLTLDMLARKSVRVIPAITGEPAKGYRLDKVQVTPESVNVSGPKGLLSKLDSVSTVAVDISGISGGFEKFVPLDLIGLSSVELGNGSAKVVVTIVKAGNAQGEK